MVADRLETGETSLGKWVDQGSLSKQQPQPSSYQKSSLMRMLLLVSEPSIVPDPAFMEYLKPRLYANHVADAYLTGICKAFANKFCPFFFASLPPEFKLCLKYQSDKESDS